MLVRNLLETAVDGLVCRIELVEVGDYIFLGSTQTLAELVIKCSFLGIVVLEMEFSFLGVTL